MKRYLVPMILLAGCAAPPEPMSMPTRSALYDGFVNQRFAWSHVSGVSGETVHFPNGAMVYDSNGRERTALYTLSISDRYCMNAGDYDQVCFTLEPTETGYASTDGTFTYDRLAGPLPPQPSLEGLSEPLERPAPVAQTRQRPTPPAPAAQPAPAPAPAPADDGFADSIYRTPIYADQPRFGPSQEAPSGGTPDG